MGSSLEQPSWRMALAHCDDMIQDAERQAADAKRRLGRLRAARRTIQQFVDDNAPWPTSPDTETK